MPESVVYNIDCMERLREYRNNHFGLAIPDPQYGIGESRRTQSRSLKCKQKNGSSLYVSTARKHAVKDWDMKRPEKVYFDEVQRVSKNQIIWGGESLC